LRRDTDVRRLFVVIRVPDQLRFGPAAGHERDPERESRVVTGGYGDSGVAGHRGRRRRADEELEVTVEVTGVRVVVRRPGRAVRQGDDRVEVVGGHERIDRRLNRWRRRRAERIATGVAAVRRTGRLEDRIAGPA